MKCKQKSKCTNGFHSGKAIEKKTKKEIKIFVESDAEVRRSGDNNTAASLQFSERLEKKRM